MSQNEEEALIQLLAIIYRKIPWQKIRTSKNIHDIFNHRVRAAARREKIYEFTSKLCNYFGLQSIPSEAMHEIEILRRNEESILQQLSDEHIPICVRAIMLAQTWKKEKKGGKNDVSEV
jgi:hypothetical protein